MKWRDEDIILHHDRAMLHTVIRDGMVRKKWSSMPYTLPDGRTGTWWMLWNKRLHDDDLKDRLKKLQER